MHKLMMALATTSALLLAGGALAPAALAAAARPDDAGDLKLTKVAASKTAPALNPLLAPWGGPHGGVPPFDQVRVEQLGPALDSAMASQRRELRAIAANPSPPTFDNTIAALERAQATLGRVRTIYDLWTGSLKTPQVEALEQRMAPKLAAFGDELVQNKRLFKRIDAVYANAAQAGLSAEQQRLAWVYRTQFIKQGARLDAAQKQRVAQINQSLASLYTRFSQNQLADEQRALILTARADLDGLNPSDVDAYAIEAERRGLKGQWAVANTRSAMEPFLLRSTRRELRERGWRLWTERGDMGDAHDNNKTVQEILALRAERSRLLGFPSFAHWQLSDSMAAEPQRAMDLMMQLWAPSVEAVKRQVAQMQTLVDAGPNPYKIQPWDYRFVAEQLRRDSYAFDANELMPYLQLEKVRDAMFWAAGKVYGFQFLPVRDVPVFHPDVSVYEVQDAQGQRVGLWYFDPYARPGKNSGAWMSSYRAQSRLDGKAVTAIVSNNANFSRGKPGEPVLLSWDDAVTMFHEFGHALHGLNSNVTYPTLASPNSLQDFGEVPSMINEHWLPVPAVLARLTNKDGQPLPQALVDKLQRSATFDKGFAKTEFLASALLDMKLHLLGGQPVDPRAFERQTLAELGMPAEMVARHRIPAFGHIFSGEGYAAGYYGYLWAEMLEHDAFEAFTEKGDPFDPELSRRLRDTIMSVGNSVDPGQAFRNFRGRDPKVDALLRDSGFAVPAAQP
ncbi:MAG: M3 family metallopeptidase [Burkholderiaceae bacterium]